MAMFKLTDSPPPARLLPDSSAKPVAAPPALKVVDENVVINYIINI
jgi:hypothetical protein